MLSSLQRFVIKSVRADVVYINYQVCKNYSQNVAVPLVRKKLRSKTKDVSD